VRPSAVSPLVEAVRTQPPRAEYVQSALLPDSSVARTIGVPPPTADGVAAVLSGRVGSVADSASDGEPGATPVSRVPVLGLVEDPAEHALATTIRATLAAQDFATDLIPGTFLPFRLGVRGRIRPTDAC
jgi:hypothetical protein